MKAPKKIFLISDSTGELGEHFTTALVSQFPRERIVLEKFNFVQDEEELNKVFSQLAARQDVKESVIFHTVLSPKLKTKIEHLSKSKHIAALDLTGPPTFFLMKNLKAKPVWNLKSIHKMNEDYFKRIRAIEFTMSHDDGMGQQTLREADIVLVGPSRTSKTPTSIFLAIKGFRVANVPLVPLLGLGEELPAFKGNPKVIGFITSSEKLQEVRIKRTIELGTVPEGYTDIREIAKEIRWSREIYEKHGWKLIDVSDRAVEETAALVIRHIQKKAK